MRRLLNAAFALFAAYSLILSAKRPLRPYLTVIGGVDMCDGLGRQSIELIDAMKEKVSLNFIPTYIKNWTDVPKDLKKLAKGRKKRLGKVIVCEEPLQASYKKLKRPANRDQLRIAYSMLESTRIPAEWVKMLNTYFDAVAVPDRFLIEAYQLSGVTIPVFELPLGRDFRQFLESPLKQKRNIPFVFGNFSSGIGRKNLPLLIRAFYEAFGTRTDVRLVINCRICEPSTHSQIEEELERAAGANISFTKLALDNQAYLELLSSIDCFVSTSKGEGFSIQPREAMAMGIPVIVADNTAQHTICASGLVKSIPCPEEEPAFYEWYPRSSLGSFFSASQKDIAAALIEMEEQYASYLEKGPIARKWAAQYHFDALNPLYHTLIQPEIVVLGSENQIAVGCLTTNSKTLYKKYLRLTKASPQ